MLVTTTNELAGHRIVRHVDLVRGITVRSRSVLGNMAGGIQSIFGGKLTVYVSLAETARQEALDHMIAHANDIMDGITEVLAYSTAVVVEAV
jgi:uncharacterized protein YbjQ (UPF0145 family)